MKATKQTTLLLISLVLLSCFVSLYNIDPTTGSTTSDTVTFTETGLPTGTRWNVTLNGVTKTSTTNTITYTFSSRSSYPYSIAYLPGFAPTVASGTVTMSGSETPVSVTFASTNWATTSRDSTTRNGYTYAKGPTNNQTKWSTNVTGSILFSSPVIVDNVVYIGTSGGTYGKTCALDKVTGEILWSTNYGGGMSGLTVVDGVVYRGSYAGILYALNASDGSLIWNASVGWEQLSAPAVAKGVVYVASGQGGYLYALHASNGSQIWNYSIGPSYASPIVNNGIIYIGAGVSPSDPCHFYAIHANNGSLLWNLTTSGAVWSASLVNGVLYFGMRGSSDSKVCAVNASDGSSIWNFTRTGATGVYGAPVIANGIVYLGDYAHYVYAINATTGALVWNYLTNNNVHGALAYAANGILYASSEDRNLYAFNASNGSIIWTYTFANPIDSAPAVVDDVVYIGAPNGYVYAFGIPEYILKMKTIGQGTVSPGNQTYLAPTSVDLVAIPAEGWSFSGWTGSITGTTNTTLNINAAKVVTATFTQNKYNVTFTQAGLPIGCSWNVTLDGQTVASTTNSLTFTDKVAGNYTYRVSAPYCYASNPTFGIVTVAATNVEVPVTYFERSLGYWKLGGAQSDTAQDIIATPDGGYLILGTTASYGAGSFDVYLVKVAANGTQLWNKTYGGTASDEGCGIDATPDGGYVIAASTSSYGAGNVDFWVIKVDSSGNMLWNRTFGGSRYDYARGITATPDGGCAIVGETESFGAGGSDAWLVKLNYNGSQQWNKTYGGKDYDFGYAVTMAPDGGYAITGNSNYDFYLVKTYPNGTLQWQNTYGGDSGDYGYKIIASNGNYLLAGTTYSFGDSCQAWLVMVAGNGTALWNQTYSGAYETAAYDVVETSDGAFAFAGYKHIDGRGNYDFWLVKVDSIGNTIWNKTLGGPKYDDASCLIENSDGSFALAGRTYWFSTDMTWHVLFATTDGFAPKNTLTINTIGQGTVLPGNGTYVPGEAVELQAIADAGWTFAGWSGNASGISNTTITMDSDMDVTATFTQNSYTLTMNTIGQGSVNPGNTTCSYGDEVNLEVIPTEGWEFSGWSGDASGTSNTTLTMYDNKTVTATFTKINLIATKTSDNQTYTIDITGGNISISQYSNMTITPYQSNTTTVVAFTLTGPSGTNGTGTIAIPKAAIPYGTIPKVYIDGVLAENQSYTEDNDNYYVTFSTHFSTHQINIDFAPKPTNEPASTINHAGSMTTTDHPDSTATPTPAPTVTPSPKPTANPTTQPTISPVQAPIDYGIWSYLALVVAMFVLFFVIAAIARKKRNEF